MMNAKNSFSVTGTLSLGLVLLFLCCVASSGLAQIPQTLSYQGVLTDANGNPVADGEVSIVFRLYDAAEGGNQLWEEKQTVTVVNGIFNVILGKEVPLELPFDVPYWLEIELSEDGVILQPRLELTASAYSLNARAVGDSVVTGEKIADGSAVRSINGLTDAVELEGGSNVTITSEGQRLVISSGGSNGEPTDGWTLDGNAGTDPAVNFVGTTDSAPLELRVANQRVMRYEPETAEDGPNVIGGWSGNSVPDSVVGGTIAGGGDPVAPGLSPNRVTSDYGTVGGGLSNLAGGQMATVGGGVNNEATGPSSSTVGGGRGNQARGSFATVSGGNDNRASDGFDTVCGGSGNRASGAVSSVGGGVLNKASGFRSTIGGGSVNTVSGDFATVPGGERNHARGTHSFAVGYKARAIHEGSFVWNDRSVTSGNDSLLSTAENQFLIRAAGGVGIGTNNPTEQLHVDGTALADAHTTPSSRRWKSNIRNLDNALEKVQRLRGVTYNWKEGGKPDIGLIAEEVGEVVPEVVAYEENGVDAKSVDYSRLVALLIEGMKEQQEQITALQAKLVKIQNQCPHKASFEYSLETRK